MERPSHINVRLSHSLSIRLASSGLAFVLPFVILFGLMHQRIGVIVDHFGPLHLDPVRPDKVKPLPPPDPPLIKVNPPLALPPIVDVQQPQPAGAQTITTMAPGTPAQSSGAQPAQPSIADHAAIAVAATHTRPPYPPLSQRLGEEGQVTLRLTVLADGHVGAAEIVASSGSARLDAAAREWVVTHWLYKPAIENGQPAASQALTTVQFHLNQN